MITRHNLPQNRLEPIFGSKNNGSCTSVSQSLDGVPVCAGTSVLNDGIIPALDGFNTSNSTWASELFTLDGMHERIRLSFEVDSENHDRMKLAVFNCPGMRINLSLVKVYFDSSFRPDRKDSTLGTFNIESQLMSTSCDRLLIFCVKYRSNTTESPSRFINLEIPNNNSDYVFLGEVTFLSGSNEPCELNPIKGNTT